MINKIQNQKSKIPTMNISFINKNTLFGFCPPASKLSMWRAGILVLGFILPIIGIIGCSSTVTQKPAPGSQLSLTFNLGADLVATNRYVIVLNVGATEIQVPSIVNANLPFKLPADAILPPYTRASYDTYFNTWTDLVVLQGGQFKLYRGPMSAIDQSTSPDYVWIGPTSGRGVNFKINMGYLSDTAPTLIGFKIVSTNAAGDPLDETKGTETIINQVNQTKSGTDPVEGFDPAIEIMGWSAQIE